MMTTPKLVELEKRIQKLEDAVEILRELCLSPDDKQHLADTEAKRTLEDMKARHHDFIRHQPGGRQ